MVLNARHHYSCKKGKYLIYLSVRRVQMEDPKKGGVVVEEVHSWLRQMAFLSWLLEVVAV
jgi:hypothetical protein